MPEPTQFDAREFRNALGTFTTGVTIVTTRSLSGRPIGLTANSFNSVSIDPPLVLWSIGKSSRALQDFRDADYWAVHILADGQETLANGFASKSDDKFAGVSSAEGIGGVPLLAGCVSIFQCKAEQAYDAGDHIILLGRVLEFERNNKTPLVFAQGNYAVAARKVGENEPGLACPLCGNLGAQVNTPDMAQAN